MTVIWLQYFRQDDWWNTDCLKNDIIVTTLLLIDLLTYSWIWDYVEFWCGTNDRVADSCAPIVLSYSDNPISNWKYLRLRAWRTKILFYFCHQSLRFFAFALFWYGHTNPWRRFQHLRVGKRIFCAAMFARGDITTIVKRPRRVIL